MLAALGLTATAPLPDFTGLEADSRRVQPGMVFACMTGNDAHVAQAVARGAVAVLGGAVALQYVLGIVTLLRMVPVGLATLHQLNAVLVLAAVLLNLHLSRSRAPGVLPSRFTAAEPAVVRPRVRASLFSRSN